MEKNSNRFTQAILNLDGTHDDWDLYFVKFYDDDNVVAVRAENSSKAEVLAMATRILDEKPYGVERVTNNHTGEYFPSIVSIY